MTSRGQTSGSMRARTAGAATVGGADSDGSGGPSASVFTGGQQPLSSSGMGGIASAAAGPFGSDGDMQYAQPQPGMGSRAQGGYTAGPPPGYANHVQASQAARSSSSPGSSPLPAGAFGSVARSSSLTHRSPYNNKSSGGMAGPAGAGPDRRPTGGSAKIGPSPGLFSLPGGPVGGVSRVEVRLLAVVVVFALCIRLYKIGQPSSVVFDEVHFGGFASKYIQRKFFMDVHPPLGKLIITFVAWAAGYNGKFNFKTIGGEYLFGGEGAPVPYVAVRSACAIMGVATVPLAYLTLRALSLRATTALVGALLVTLENALITQSRFMLLDAPLVFFTALTIYSWVMFCNEEKRRPFSRTWWVWLGMTGASLGCVLSVKWVGLFTTATIGICTIAQLWTHLGDTRMPIQTLVRHFVARALGLIVLPFFVYLNCFAIHLAILNHSGEGDGFMSSAFQHTLRGHGMPNTYADVALGSTITLRHLNTQGGYLHSHLHNYPAGSGQQQVTLYPFSPDENNEWYIVKAPGPGDPPPPVDEHGVPLAVEGPHEAEKHWGGNLTYLEHGMEVRLIHKRSEKRLHSHDVRPPITEADYQQEVSCYGFIDADGKRFAGDSNDHWIVEIERGVSSDTASWHRVRALRSTIRLRHSLTGAYLFSHKIALPDWGFGQQEVSANKAVGAPRAPRKKAKKQ